LLVPPPVMAPPVLTPNVLGSMDTISIVRVDTSAPSWTTDIGDHTIALVAIAGAAPPVRFTGGLAAVPVVPTMAAFVGSAETVAYVREAAGLVYLRLPRTAGDAIALTLDLTDPLGRSVHATLSVPFAVPESAPVIGAFNMTRAAGVLRGAFTINAPVPSDLAKPWTLAIRVQRAIPPVLPSQTRSFDVADIPTIASPAAMPNPAPRPESFAIAQIQGTDPRQILFWLKTGAPVRVQIAASNAEGQTATANMVSP